MELPRVIGRFPAAARLAASPTVRNTAWLGSSMGLVMLLNAAGTALFARVLGVSDFGVYSLIILLWTLFTDLADLGVGSSIIRFASRAIEEKDEPRIDSIFAVFWRFKLIYGTLLLIAGAAFSRAIIETTFHFIDDRLTAWFQLTLLAIAANIAAAAFQPLFQSYRRFRAYAVVTTLRAAAKFAAIAAAVLIFSTFTVALGIWIEIGATILLILLSLILAPRKKFSLAIRDRRAAADIFSFSKWLSLQSVIYLAGTRVDVFLVGYFTGTHDLGLYAAALKVAGMAAVLASAYWSALLPEVSAAAGSEALRRKMRQAYGVVGLMLAGIAILALAADPVVRILFGGKFAPAVPVLRVMCLGLAGAVGCYPTNAILFALNKTWAFPLAGIAALTALTLSCVFLIPTMGIMGAAIGFALNGLLLTLLSLLLYAAVARPLLARGAPLPAAGER